MPTKSKSRKSAGLLLFRRIDQGLEVFLAHMGGPFWARKDAGGWTIPKGEFESEPPLEAAKREFREEIGFVPEGTYHTLRTVRQPGGKTVLAFAVEGNCDPAKIHSNTFEMEWPRGSGNMRSFPEIDRAAWFTLAEARMKILKGQVLFLDELEVVFKI